MHLAAFAAALAAWQPLPTVPALGYSSIEGVRVGPHAVFVAGATSAATRVHALAYDLRAKGWRPVPPVPLRWRAEQVTLAAGDRLIVWGGASNTGRLRDGGVLQRGRWHRMAPAPIHGFDRAAVWTGREMVVPAGAAYDPAADRWRTIRPAPFAVRAAVWTGRRVLAVGDGATAAYDPARNRWRALAPAPIPAPRAVWTGSEMLVVSGSRLDAYDPARDLWQRLRRSPLGDRDGFTAVWNGRELLVWGGVRVDCGGCFLADGAAFDPATRRWRRLPASPLSPRDRHAAVPLRRGMVVWAGDGAVLSTR